MLADVNLNIQLDSLILKIFSANKKIEVSFILISSLQCCNKNDDCITSIIRITKTYFL